MPSACRLIPVESLPPSVAAAAAAAWSGGGDKGRRAPSPRLFFSLNQGDIKISHAQMDLICTAGLRTKESGAAGGWGGARV